MNQNQRILLTVLDMMNYLKISRATAYRLLNQTGFPFIRIHSSYRIPKDLLDEWIDNQINEKS